MDKGLKCWYTLSRRRPIDAIFKEQLKRALTLLDLVGLAVGSTLGLGVYVLAGQVAYNIAGPGVVISFLFAAFASLLSGLCYAEFASRVTTAGSAYVYSYVTVGEFVAFSIGWTLILEYIIAVASVASGLSQYLNALFGNKYSEALSNAMPIKVPYLGDFPDFLGFAFILILTAIIAAGVKESTIINNILTSLNLVTIVTVVIAGAFYAKVKNWFIPESEVPEGFGTGGFLPFGFQGVSTGAARCFYGMVGFDCVTTCGEEAKNPKRDIPLSIFISLTIITIAYLAISIVLTMMLEYFNQNPNAPFPHAFTVVDQIPIMWTVTIGAIFALSCSLIGCFFPLPRVLYAMALDGLIWKIFGKVHPKTQTPVWCTIIAGLLSGFMCLIFDLNQLVDMLSIGTLMAYTMVCMCVLILRYEDPEMDDPEVTISSFGKQLFNIRKLTSPDLLSSRIVKGCIVGIVVLILIWCTSNLFFPVVSMGGIIFLTLCGVLAIFLIIIIYIQPKSDIELLFKVALGPIIPCLAILINLYLIYQLDAATWVRFFAWMVLGYIIYFGYGIQHSIINPDRIEDEENKLNPEKY